MTPFFIQKEVLGEKIIIWVKYGNSFTQIIMFSLKKVDDLRAREREREEKGTTNSAPWFHADKIDVVIVFWFYSKSLTIKKTIK